MQIKMEIKKKRYFKTLNAKVTSVKLHLNHP